MSIPSVTAPFEQIPSQLRKDAPGNAAFPLFLNASSTSLLNEVCNWLSQHRTEVEIALINHGGIFLRGLPIKTAADFDEIMNSLGMPPKP